MIPFSQAYRRNHALQKQNDLEIIADFEPQNDSFAEIPLVKNIVSRYDCSFATKQIHVQSYRRHWNDVNWYMHH